MNSPEREGMRIPAMKLDGEGAAGVELSLANPTAKTAWCGGDPSGGRSSKNSGGGWLHGAGAMGSSGEVGEMGKKREGASGKLK